MPTAWEEDIRANLSKHKQKVITLRKELENEERYVQYLERLLADIEENKKKLEAENPESDGNDLDNIADPDSLSKVNITYLYIKSD